MLLAKDSLLVPHVLQDVYLERAGVIVMFVREVGKKRLRVRAKIVPQDSITGSQRKHNAGIATLYLPIAS